MFGLDEREILIVAVAAVSFFGGLAVGLSLGINGGEKAGYSAGYRDGHATGVETGIWAMQHLDVFVSEAEETER